MSSDAILQSVRDSGVQEDLRNAYETFIEGDTPSSLVWTLRRGARNFLGVDCAREHDVDLRTLRQVLLEEANCDDTRILQVVGDSGSAFDEEAIPRALQLLAEILTPDYTVEYGYTASRNDANWLVSEHLRTSPDRGLRAIANVVGQSIDCLQNPVWEGSQDVTSFVVVYKKGRSTQFGEDVWLSDGIMFADCGDKLICFEGGFQAFRQCVNVLLKGIQVLAVTDLRPTVEYNRFSAARLLCLLKATDVLKLVNHANDYLIHVFGNDAERIKTEDYSHSPSFGCADSVLKIHAVIGAHSDSGDYVSIAGHYVDPPLCYFVFPTIQTTPEYYLLLPSSRSETAGAGLIRLQDLHRSHCIRVGAMEDISVSPEASVSFQPVRKPDPNEHRLIARHLCRFYNNLVIAGIYNFPSNSQHANSETPTVFDHFGPALHECVQTHAFLSAVLQKTSGKCPTYARISKINLKTHFNILDVKDLQVSSKPSNDDDLTAAAINHLQNNPILTFFDSVENTPPWRLDVFPLESKDHTRYLVAFTYSHVIGDGMSGMAFHKTLLKGLKIRHTNEHTSCDVTASPNVALPGLPKLPISFSFLLLPALGHYLPTFIRSLFGFKASVSGADDATWIGSKTFAGGEGSLVRTAMELLSVNSKILSDILRVCRSRETKFTPMLNEVIARCLCAQQLTATNMDISPTANFVSSTPTNLRKLAGMSDDVFGIMASTVYVVHQQYSSPLPGSAQPVIDKQFWEDAKKARHQIAAATATLQNQPIGLLRFVSDIDKWMKHQIGQKRDSSWELSNLMSFDGGNDPESVTVEKLWYCQPADATGSPLGFNIVSVQGGDLVICVAWQPGALGLTSTGDPENSERSLVKDLVKDMDKHLKAIAML